MFEDITQIRLMQIHNDILALTLCMTGKEMHNAGLISDREYSKMLQKQYEVISNQITASQSKGIRNAQASQKSSS